MRLKDPKSRDDADGRVDSHIDVNGDLVEVEDDGTFEHPAISREWAAGYAEREGVSISTVLVGDGPESASDASEDICGVTMSDGSTCERPADECPYH